MHAFLEEISLLTAVKLLAYIHHYTIPYLPGRCLSASHLRHISVWIDAPAKNLCSLRGHKQLAALLMLLQAAGLLAHDDQNWSGTPLIHSWLQLPDCQKYQALLEAIAACRWQSTILAERLDDLLDEAYGQFLFQTLSRQQAAPQTPPEKSTLHPQTELLWILHLPPFPRLDSLFHLLQISTRHSANTLHLTPTSINQAQQRGYSLTIIEHLLTQATGDTLSSAQRAQLIAWHKRGQAYSLQTVHLLTTAQPEQMSAVLANGRLQRKVIQQISPRHATVQADSHASLQKWLDKQGYMLDVNLNESTTIEPNSYHWLALRLLSELAHFSTPPISLPQNILEQAAASVPPEHKPHLESVVQTLVQNIHEAIRGYDQLFPAPHPESTQHLQQLQEALVAEKSLQIEYQALGAITPTWRTIQPLSLQVKGGLHYLTAYCHRAEMNLTFRLDRIKDIKEGQASFTP